MSKDEIIRIADSIGMILVNPDNIKSRHDYNKYRFSYNAVFSDVPQEIINMEVNNITVDKQDVNVLAWDLCKEKDKYLIRIIFHYMD